MVWDYFGVSRAARLFDMIRGALRRVIAKSGTIGSNRR